MDEQTKYKVYSLLLNGHSAADIGSMQDVDVTYATVLRMQRQLNEAKANNSVAELINLDEAVANELLDAIAKNAPAAIAGEIVSTTEAVKKSVAGLEVLNTELIATAKFINTRIRSLSTTVESVSELSMLVTSLCELQVAFFNKNSTQVNVQNNYGSEERQYGRYLSDAPAQ